MNDILEVVVAPSYEEEALNCFKQKNVRVLQLADIDKPQDECYDLRK